MKVVEQYGRPAWVIGSPISHTLSPPIHNSAFQKSSLAHRYFAMEVEKNELSEFLTLFRKIDALGANLTIPLKEAVTGEITNHTESVNQLGAANTLFWDGSELVLDNTDVYGFSELIRPWKDEISEVPVCMMGAGGAAKACLYALGNLSVPRVYLWNRTYERAVRLRERFSYLDIEVVSRDQLEQGVFEGSVVINATSLGLEETDPSPFPTEAIREHMIGVDLIYHHETRFMSAFSRRGKESAGGLTMLVCQAAKAWEHWTGVEPPVDEMMNTARSRLRE